jgi:hypothetical protein
VDEARHAQDTRQVVHVVAAVGTDQTLLQCFELVERAVSHQPIAVPFEGRRLDDDVRLGVKLLRQRLALVQVDEQRAHPDDVLLLAAIEIGLVDGDIDASACRVQVAKLVPVPLKRAVEDAGEGVQLPRF